MTSLISEQAPDKNETSKESLKKQSILICSYHAESQTGKFAQNSKMSFPLLGVNCVPLKK